MIDAYSQPITPPPTTMKLLGMRSIPSTSSESSTSGSSNGISGTRRGELPVAIRKMSAVILRAPTSIVLASMNFAAPWITSTLWRMKFACSRSRSARVTISVWRMNSPIEISWSWWSSTP